MQLRLSNSLAMLSRSTSKTCHYVRALLLVCMRSGHVESNGPAMSIRMGQCMSLSKCKIRNHSLDRISNFAHRRKRKRTQQALTVAVKSSLLSPVASLQVYIVIYFDSIWETILFLRAMNRSKFKYAFLFSGWPWRFFSQTHKVGTAWAVFCRINRLHHI